MKNRLNDRLRRLAGCGLRGMWRLLLAGRYAGRACAMARNGQPRSVLVIRGDGGIGDFVLFLPALRILRRHYADARLSLLVGSESAELASTFAEVDEVISFQVKRYRYDVAYRLRVIRSLRERQFGTAINPIYSREPLTDELLYCCGARERIAFEGDLNNIDAKTRAANNRYFTGILPGTAGVLHESERNRQFVEQLIGAHTPVEEFGRSLPLSESHLNDAHAFLSRQGLDPRVDLIVAMCPGALHPIKIWPEERFAELADRLASKFGARILLCGSTSDRERGERISGLTNTRPANVIGETTLPQLGAILHLCALYVGNDSGPVHIAAAVGTPTVCILGGGHFGRFLPYPNGTRHRAVFETMQCYHCHWKCVYDAPHCILDISVEKVWQAVRSLMEQIVLPGRTRATVVAP
jgi:ADP-heptose:LPS heptosyltransferase